MGRRILLLGHTGKMGLALHKTFQQAGEIIGRNSTDLDAANPVAVRELVTHCRPDVVLNTIAFMGVDACEKEPATAQRINSLLPRQLAQLSADHGFTLIHFSTDAVFKDNDKDRPWLESDCPMPINIYGTSKLAADHLVAHHAPRHYLFRLPVLFGAAVKTSQFVEKMLALAAAGRPVLRVATDIVSSPSYSRDLANAALHVFLEEKPWGLYHLCNQGQASLYDLMKEIAHHLHLSCEIQPASHKDFPAIGEKQTFLPMSSEKLPPLRPWQEAAADYCRVLKGDLP